MRGALRAAKTAGKPKALVGGTLPTLTLTGPLTYSTTAAAGSLVANIGNVPAGVTPTLTPNDGRLVIAGSAGAWTVVTGLSASTAGTITLGVAATGATGASAGVTVVAGVAYLPTLSSNTLAVIGAKRMVSGYSGNLYRLRKSSGGTMEVPPASASNPLPDYAAIASWAGSDDLFVTGVYEQGATSQNAQATYYPSVATPANEPAFDLAQALAGCCPFLFDGICTGTANSTFPAIFKQMTIPLSFDRNNISIFEVIDPFVSLQYNMYWNMMNGAASISALYTAGNSIGLSVGTSGGFGGSGSIPRAQPSVIGFVGSAAARKIHVRENVVSGAAVAGQTGTQIVFGNFIDTTQQPLFNGAHRRWATVIYPTLSDADALTLRTALATMFSVQTAFDRRVVIDGDSIAQQVATTKLRNSTYYMSPLLNGSPEVFNMAVSGQRMDQVYAARVARFAPLYTAAYGAGKCSFLEECGINDLGAQAATGAALYNTRGALPLVNYLKGLGFKTGLQRLLPTTTAAYTTATATIQAEKANYNALLPGAADFLVDPTTNTAFDTDSDADNTTYFADKLHLTSAGAALIGPMWAAALNAATA